MGRRWPYGHVFVADGLRAEYGRLWTARAVLVAALGRLPEGDPAVLGLQNAIEAISVKTRRYAEIFRREGQSHAAV